MRRRLHIRSRHRSAPPVGPAIIALLVLLAWPGHGAAEPDPEILAAEQNRQEQLRPDGIHVLDGSYVLDRGELHVNITNHGLIGSQYTQTFPFSNAPSGQWPGGSGREYLWGAGLWIGGSRSGQLSVTTGQPERELRPGANILDTIYESRDNRVVRPVPEARVAGRRPPWSQSDDDNDGLTDEDMLNGRDDDGDGAVDEDYGQIAAQMFTCTMSDDTGLVRELYPDHTPLGLTVVQRAATYETSDADDFVLLDYQITNTGVGDLNDVYLGFYVDCDIQRRGNGGSNPDDTAGFYRGALRGSDGSFHRMEIGWMQDADSADPLPGVFGALLLGHATDPLEYYAPHLVGVQSFQIFATNARSSQNGEPLSDQERYELMAREAIDPDRGPDKPGDLKFMISSGPFSNLRQGRQLDYRVALVVGNGLDGMLRNALRASEIHRGRYLDVDHDPNTGGGGEFETLVCLGDYPPYTTGSDPIYDYRFVMMDEACVGPDPRFGYEVINPGALFTAPDGRRCTYVNADNCEECFRRHGRECTVENGLFWVSTDSYYETGNGGERYVPWIEFTDFPPRSPQLRVVPGDNSVEVFWDDVSEFDQDPMNGLLDFESYRVWRIADWIRPEGTTDQAGPQSVLWSMLGEYDLINVIPGGSGGVTNDQNLGRNTGLEGIRYVPVCLSDPRFAGLAEVIQAFVDADVGNRILTFPPLRNSRGAVIPGREPFLPWEPEPAVLDTFFAVASRAAAPAPDAVVGKRGRRYYHFIDLEVHNGFQIFYSVVAADHALQWTPSGYVLTGYGVQGDPSNNRQLTTPAPPAQTVALRESHGVNITVVPNPATREALAEMQGQPPSVDNPTGVRVLFNNLPAAHNRITVYTASGDRVAEVAHDGRQGRGTASWNLMSRNGQEVVSGIYLFVVESDDARFAPFRGHFVVIR